MSNRANIVVVGGGIVGLATAYWLTRKRPQLKVAILEKEAEIALHQTGRNSGVLHSGIYYKPGSAKALNCRRGKSLMLDFCSTNEVPHDICGKVIVATNPLEVTRLQALAERGRDNGVPCQWLDQAALRSREPHAAGEAALLVPEAGIVDYRQVCRKLLTLSEAQFVPRAEVTRISETSSGLIVESNHGVWTPETVINCAGLHSDRVCQRSGIAPGLKIVPFKGEYYRLTEEAGNLCRHLIYPVPDPNFPFLGVHLTRMISGGVEVGPNAVLALGREAYGKTDINLSDLFETLTYPGFLKLALGNVRMGLGEMHRSVSKAAFVRALQKLCPETRSEHLISAPSGIRAQAVQSNGSLEDDFRILTRGRQIHVLNAPSPAATASLAIGETIADLLT